MGENSSFRGDRQQAAPWFVLAAFGLGQAVQANLGTLHPHGIAWLTFAYASLLLGLLLPELPGARRYAERIAVALAGLGVAYQFTQLVTELPAIYLRLAGPQPLAPFHSGLVICALLVGGGLALRPWLGRLLLPLLLLGFAALGHWLLRTTPAPFIDVWVFQKEASATLLRGENPYAMDFPDIYGSSPYYGEGLSLGGRLKFGFPYPPLSLLLVLPAHVLFDDYRYAQLAALLLSALFIATARPGRLGYAAAALFLFTPRGFFVLEQGWTEPLLVLGLSGSVFCACRFPRALPYVLGLFLVSKQYTVLLLPALYLLLQPLPPGKELLRFVGKLIVMGALVTLPLALWNFKAFWHDVVALQVYQPFRVEALSYLAWIAQKGGAPWPTAVAFLAALAGAGLGLWRAARTPSGFAASVALICLGFFAFNKQAFCNYYYFVIGAACVTLGALSPAAFPLVPSSREG